MMDGKKVVGGLITGLKAVGLLLSGIGGIVIGMFIFGIIFGILFGLTDTLGLDNATVELLGNVSTSWYSFVGSLLTGTNLVGNLVQVAIVIVVFGGIVGAGYLGYTKLKGRKGGNQGDY